MSCKPQYIICILQWNYIIILLVSKLKKDYIFISQVRTMVHNIRVPSVGVFSMAHIGSPIVYVHKDRPLILYLSLAYR